MMIEPFKNKAVSRLKKARGQIDGVIKMIEGNKYCIDILTQVLALQGAIREVGPLILESHLYTCGGENLGSKNQKKKEKFIKEIIRVSSLSGR